MTGIKARALATSRAVSSIRSDSGSGIHMYHMATELRCHSVPPPPLAEYDAWLAAHPIGKRAHSSITARKLRRAVVMRRNGQTLSDIAVAIGMSHGAVSTWLAKLPPELAVGSLASASPKTPARSPFSLVER